MPVCAFIHEGTWKNMKNSNLTFSCQNWVFHDQFIKPEAKWSFQQTENNVSHLNYYQQDGSASSHNQLIHSLNYNVIQHFQAIDQDSFSQSQYQIHHFFLSCTRFYDFFDNFSLKYLFYHNIPWLSVTIFNSRILHDCNNPDIYFT